MNIKEKIIRLCDNMISFWQKLKKEIETIQSDDNLELICKWYDYFEKNADTVGNLSETKWIIEDAERELIMKGELKYEN